MTKEEKQILLKDLCMRLPYGVKVKSSRRQMVSTLSLDIMTDFHLGCTVKPYLRPLSSMTKEEANEACRLEIFENRIISIFPNNPTYHFTVAIGDAVIDWLNENHFDYRNLIEKRLALEAPENMYKTE